MDRDHAVAVAAFEEAVALDDRFKIVGVTGIPRDYQHERLHDALALFARDAGRTILTEAESKQVLDAYYIPTVRTVVARTLEEAADQAERIGYPVVLKLFSETITHKTDVGGVQLNLADRDAVERAWRRIRTSVTEKVGAEHFQGVTVQPMIKSGDG